MVLHGQRTLASDDASYRCEEAAPGWDGLVRSGLAARADSSGPCAFGDVARPGTRNTHKAHRHTPFHSARHRVRIAVRRCLRYYTANGLCLQVPVCKHGGKKGRRAPVTRRTAQGGSLLRAWRRSRSRGRTAPAPRLSRRSPRVATRRLLRGRERWPLGRAPSQCRAA